MESTRILFFLAISLYPGALSAAPRWDWTDEELRSIEALEKKVSEQDGVYRLELPTWKVETHITRRFTAEIGFFMELFTATFTSLVKARVAAPIKPTLVVFDEVASYQKIVANDSRGFFRSRWDEKGRWVEFHVYTYLERRTERYFPRFYHDILLHEGTHALMRRYLGKAPIPPWFDEGLATYFQSWSLRETTAENRKNRYGRSVYRPVVQRAAQGKGPGLALLQHLLDISFKGWDPDNMGPRATRHYAFAESFVDFLLASGKRASILKQVFTRLKRGAGAAPLIDAKQVAALEQAWHRSIKEATR